MESVTRQFKGLRADQPFVPGMAFDDGDDRVLEDGRWWRVISMTEMELDPRAPADDS